MLQRILYIGYYLKQLNKETFSKFVLFVQRKTGKNRLSIYSDVIRSSLKYNISLLDYFYFGFYEKSKTERNEYAGTGYMYEYQKKMNPKSERIRLEDKIQFLRAYDKFIKRKYVTLASLKSSKNTSKELLDNDSGKIVLKLSTGQVGAEVKVYQCNQFDHFSLIKEMENMGFDLAEEFVVQHPSLMNLSPSGLNTLRLITQIQNKNVILIGARLRISVNSEVDNMAAGNIAAPINISTGKIFGPGVYSDITKNEEIIHPVTKQRIIDFKIPYWNESVNMVSEAALLYPENKSIGWDIAISEKGPELIEGNHNWCKLLWQLPVQKGLKKELNKFIV